ncbi:nitrate reductase [Candidatus Aerophobetes bacterium]|nr:nitrate reductase [Candidatus Aerophobetes bacterium]
MGVSNENGKLRKVLLCKPDYLKCKWDSVDETINEIMRNTALKGKVLKLEDAKKQHQELSEALKSAGVELLYIDSLNKSLPYQCYTRDIGTSTERGVLLGRFKEPIRQGETNSAEEFFIKKEIPIFGKIKKGVLEGGDIHYVDNETIAIGIGARTTKEGIQEFKKNMKGLNLQIIPVEFPSKYLHLDVLFAVIGERTCLACVEELPDSFIKVLRDKKFKIIKVSKNEAMNLNNNVLSLGEERILSFKENGKINSKLKALGFEVFIPSLSVFNKLGGGPRCLTFPLEREESIKLLSH